MGMIGRCDSCASSSAPGLNFHGGPRGPSGVMAGEMPSCDERLIVVAQRARAGVRGGAANHLAAQAAHDHGAEFAVDRRGDQESQFHARGAQLEQLLDAE